MRLLSAKDDAGWPHHVLIMDSDIETASLLVHHFRELGCVVVHVADNLAVWPAVQAQLPDLLVIERRLRDTPPVQQLITRLLTDPVTAAACRIVVASGLQFADLTPGAQVLIEDGADGVIDEPYTRRAVQDLIEDVVPAGEHPVVPTG